MHRSLYRKCVVPHCTSSAQSNPKKLLIHVPIQEEIRTKWLKLAGRKPDQFATKTSIYFCEDHFDLEKDMENYMKYKLMGYVKKVVLRKGSVPSKFHCQDSSNVNMASTENIPKSRSKKRRRLLSPSQDALPTVSPIEEEVEEASTDTLAESWSSLSCELENMDSNVFIKEEVESTGSPDYTDDNECPSDHTVTIKVEPDFQVDVKETFFGLKVMKTSDVDPLKEAGEQQNKGVDQLIDELSSSNPSCTCLIHSLIDKSFKNLPLYEQKTIINTGRPIPQISDNFNITFYEKFTWLCGCDTHKKLYCWCCILFSLNSDTVWNKQGCANIENLLNECSSHVLTEIHIKSFIKLKEFEKTYNENTNLKINLENHNKQVTMNRNILKRLIDIICFVAKQKLNFYRNSEALSSMNCLNSDDLMKFLIEYDEELGNLLKSSQIFSDLTNIQNDLIVSIKKVLFNEIVNDVKSADFIVLLINKTSDCDKESQLSIIIRYINGDFMIQERFLTYYDINSVDRSALEVSKLILSTLEAINCDRKMICQCYHGATVSIATLNETQVIIRDRHPYSIFLPNFDYKFNTILIDSIQFIADCRIFLTTLISLGNFFTESINRIQLLDKLVEKKFPNAAPFQWNFSDRLIYTISNHRENIISFFENILKKPDSWDNDTLSKVNGFINFLESFHTVFLLNLFEKLFPKLDEFFVNIKNHLTEIKYCSNEIKLIKKFIKDTRDKGLNLILEKTLLQVGEIKFTKNENSLNKIRSNFLEIIDIILMSLNIRFIDVHHLKFLKLFDSTKFLQYKNHFPEVPFNVLSMTYPFFDFPKLRTELNVIYSQNSFQNLNVFEIFNKIKNDGLQEVLPEVFKLCKLTLILPVFSDSIEKSDSPLNLLQKFPKFDNFSVLTIESDTLMKLKDIHDEDNNFYRKIIEEFLLKEKRSEFEYK